VLAASIIALMMEAVSISEMLVNYQAARHNNTEDSRLNPESVPSNSHLHNLSS
jgi:hypothetical protein